MILAGMGPVVAIETDAGKWFSSFYALFSGVAFITNIGFFMAAAVHASIASFAGAIVLAVIPGVSRVFRVLLINGLCIWTKQTNNR